MKRRTILILGDSTSMTIGAEREMYPFHLANMRSWASETRMVNCSLPGFTSADACAFFFRNRKQYKCLAAVVIYLGNCDAISSELRKGKYSQYRQWKDALRGIFVKKNVKARLKNRLLYFKWNSDFDPSIEAPEHPQDFDYNISRVVRICERIDVPVILVRPQAHVLFPAGIGKGNFMFYKYLGIYEQIAKRLVIEDTRFNDALQFQEDREFKKAMEAYEHILLNSGPLSSNLEFQNVVVNNYAVCAAEVNDFDEAEYLLNLLLKERGARREIILFNLAQISRLKGDIEEGGRRLAEAYESDQSMYRVREDYKHVVDQISVKFSNVSKVDLREFIFDNDYVDHCHPLPKSQKLIAKFVAEKLLTPELQGDQLLEIENHLYNPEYLLGNMSKFHSYFKTFAPFSSEEIEKFMTTAKISYDSVGGSLVSDSDPLFEKVPREIKMALEYYLKHPCFPQVEDMVAAHPIFPSDVGRFPEYFLTRYVIPYLKVVEKTQVLSHLLALQTGLLRSSEQFASILPNTVMNNIPNDLVFDLEYERVRLPAILQKVNTMLVEHLKQGNQIYNRLKTTIFWYFRETLRFGAHSRISMRYDRMSLEFMAEGLAVAAVLDFKITGHVRFEIRCLLERLEETVQTHECYCRKFSLEHDCHDIINEYDLKLMDIAKKIEATDSEMLAQHKLESGKCLS